MGTIQESGNSFFKDPTATFSFLPPPLRLKAPASAASPTFFQFLKASDLAVSVAAFLPPPAKGEGVTTPTEGEDWTRRIVEGEDLKGIAPCLA